MITVYTSSTCPRCKILKSKLAQANIDFNECSNVEKVVELGFDILPVVEIDGEFLDMKSALNKLNI